jgi:CRP-like cAMP-binding protein
MPESTESEDKPQKLLDIEGKSTEEILAQVDLFAGLGTAALRRVAALGATEVLKKNDTAFSEGDAGDKFYLILEGGAHQPVRPRHGRENLAILRAGAYFGDVAHRRRPRSAAALAHEKARLFVINRRDLEDLLFVDRDLAYEVLWNFVRTCPADCARPMTR